MIWGRSRQLEQVGLGGHRQSRRKRWLRILLAGLLLFSLCSTLMYVERTRAQDGDEGNGTPEMESRAFSTVEAGTVEDRRSKENQGEERGGAIDSRADPDLVLRSPKRNFAQEEREGHVELELERLPTVLSEYGSSHSPGARKELETARGGGAGEEQDSGRNGSTAVPLTMGELLSEHTPAPSQRVHAFYYPWYANPEVNGKWAHWNHEVLPPPPYLQKGEVFIPHRFRPPEHIGANFYPALGLYSSTDETVMHHHMAQMARARIGVVCTSWYPPEHSDGQLEGNPGFSDRTVRALLDAAHAHGLKVNFHHEPYKSRNAESLKRDIRYIVEHYGEHPGLYRHPSSGLPMLYVYDSYLTPAAEWATVLGDPTQHPGSIRGTAQDAVVIALLVQSHEKRGIVQGGFDGFYTYFAAQGFTFGSTPRNWGRLKSFADTHNVLFIPSIGPGYVDTRIRPWNAENTRGRKGGQYYSDMFETAVGIAAQIVSITSFNEWHEGSQIEPAIPKRVEDDGSRDAGGRGGGWFEYEDYRPHDPNFYLALTEKLATKFLESVPEGSSAAKSDTH